MLKDIVTAEINNIFKLILACLDPNYLIDLANKKIAAKEYGMGSLEFTKRSWNKGIGILVEENNDKNKNKNKIELPKNYDFFGYVYNKLKARGENQAEAQEGASWVLYFCFIPGASERIKSKIKETKDEETQYYDKRLVKRKTPQEVANEAEADDSIDDVVTRYRKNLDSGKYDEKYTFVIAFQTRANQGVNQWFDLTSGRKEVQPKEKKDDDSGEKKDTLEEISGPDKTIEEILSKKLKKDFFDFIDEEKKEDLISKDAYSFLQLKKHNPDIKKEKILKELKLLPETSITDKDKEDKSKKDDLLKEAEKEYRKIIEEIKYIFARYAYEYDDADLLSAMKRKDPHGRILLPTDSNKKMNPYQKKFTKKNIEDITKYLDDNYDKGYIPIKKELSKDYNSKLIKLLDTLHQDHKSVEGLLEFLEKYKKSGAGKDLLEYSNSLTKKSSSKIANLLEYLQELIQRIES